MSDIQRNRDLLLTAQEKGMFSTLSAYFRLSGPAWLQSAITLGGASLGSALYLGVLGGTSFLWLNLLAIIVGVIMLASISYVVLSSGERPYQAINNHVNPILGVGWVTATILANMIWVLPQFGLCFEALEKNLLPGTINGADEFKYGISIALFVFATVLVYLNWSDGSASRLFDVLLKSLVAMIIICFVAVVISLFSQGQLDVQQILIGFIPRPDQWFAPVPSVSELLDQLPSSAQNFWSRLFVDSQRNVMVSTMATVVGINMTFLLPYSMLNRGWDRPFRGLAVFDLITGLAIPFVIVTSCIVIASAFSFHAQADEDFLSSDPAVVAQSPIFANASKSILKSMTADDDSLQVEKLDDEQVARIVASVSIEERKLAAMLVKPNTELLAKSLVPLLGESKANLVFGIGVLGMGFTTMLVLMMINGFAFAELFGTPNSKAVRMLGAVSAGLVGVMWPAIWKGDSQTWLIILASTFGAILLPIAYISFFALMNSRNLLKDDLPAGATRWIWNSLMGIGVVVALAQAISSLYTKLYNSETEALITLDSGNLILGGIITFALLALIGFSAAQRSNVVEE